MPDDFTLIQEQVLAVMAEHDRSERMTLVDEKGNAVELLCANGLWIPAGEGTDR